MFREKDYLAHRRKKDGSIQSLSQHLEETSKLAGEFASKIGLKKYGEVMGLLHDIGKASQEFKYYIESAVGLINPDEDDYVDVCLKRKIRNRLMQRCSELKAKEQIGQAVLVQSADNKLDDYPSLRARAEGEVKEDDWKDEKKFR